MSLSIGSGVPLLTQGQPLANKSYNILNIFINIFSGILVRENNGGTRSCFLLLKSLKMKWITSLPLPVTERLSLLFLFLKVDCLHIHSNPCLILNSRLV